ncbi:hypothetical protein Baya_10275 [Bagarius yarrelli]|uniref:Uncharacterized protein n=1 Tax=Bagarius yarrelli TaxID=175774 RepID=A0A556UY24_BAGYA|nr:hypothetical protein Baya_10275 [Bagarius yarrelli]
MRTDKAACTSITFQRLDTFPQSIPFPFSLKTRTAVVFVYARVAEVIAGAIERTHTCTHTLPEYSQAEQQREKPARRTLHAHSETSFALIFIRLTRIWNLHMGNPNMA